MKKLNLKFKNESYKKYHRSFYEITDEKYITENGKVIKLGKTLVNLSIYLKSKNLTLNDIFDISIEHKCKQCENNTKLHFRKNYLIVYHFCSLTCQQKFIKNDKKQTCRFCGNIFYSINKIKGTCGKKDCVKKYYNTVGESIKQTHWRHSNNREKIEMKRLQTRAENDKLFNRKYIPWNKDKHGIYTKETIEKIRNATINQMAEHKIKKTKIEKLIENFLIEKNIKYIYSFILKQRQYDFYLKDSKILIEADGDYWHGNPIKYNVLSDHQLLKQKDDKIKNIIALENGFKIIRFWEHDIHTNFEKVKTKIIQAINENNGKNIL